MSFHVNFLTFPKNVFKKVFRTSGSHRAPTGRQLTPILRYLSTGAPNLPTDSRPYVEIPFSYSYGRSSNALQYRTIGDHLDERVANETGTPMIISAHEGIERTYSAFNEDVNRIAKSLYEDLGLKGGDVAGLWGLNTYNWLTIQYACARVGVILCTINPYYQKGELLYALKQGDIKALFMPGGESIQENVNKFGAILSQALAEEAQANWPGDESGAKLLLEHVVTFDGQPYGNPLSGHRSIKTHSLESLKAGKTSTLEASITGRVTPDDPAIIMFTSGTTGAPKGAYLSHFTLTNNSRLCNGSLTRPHGDRISYCVPLPFFHSFPFTFGCLALAVTPIQFVSPSLRYNLVQLVETMSKYQTTHLVATPTLVIDMVKYLKAEKVTLPHLKCIISGGASMPIETAAQLHQVVPSLTDFRIGYGATELGPTTTLSREWHTFSQRIETIGTVCEGTQVKIVNPISGETVKLGQTGEILVRGYNTMIGYWKDPLKTAEALDEAGWYKTGDLAAMDEGGFLKIVGRTKEMLAVGGENVYPREIEEVLHKHPGIQEAYVIGIPDARKGEEVCAWIKLTDKAEKVTEDEVKAFCKENLAYFKVPKVYLFVESFPVTSTGKAQKFIMRQMTIEKLRLKGK